MQIKRKKVSAIFYAFQIKNAFFNCRFAGLRICGLPSLIGSGRPHYLKPGFVKRQLKKVPFLGHFVCSPR